MTALSDDLRALAARLGDVIASGRDLEPVERDALEALAHVLDALLAAPSN